MKPPGVVLLEHVVLAVGAFGLGVLCAHYLASLRHVWEKLLVGGVCMLLVAYLGALLAATEVLR